MNLIYLVIAILYNCQLLSRAQDSYACSDNYCAAFGNCPDVKCKASDLVIMRNATHCGCCHKCVKEIEENKECETEMTGNIPGTQCKPHLLCVPDKNGKGFCQSLSKAQKSECEQKRFDKSSRMNELTTGEPIPDCDEFGEYEAKQCKNGTMCKCVNKFGKPIFGAAPYDKAKDMDCLCSRQYDELNRQISYMNYSIDPVFYLRCKSNGNYEPFQFVNNLTYCVNTTSGELRDRPVHKKDIQQLACRDYKYDYISECIKNYTDAIEEIKRLEDNDHLVVGFDVPKCDLDGTFAPIQCLNSHCYCVNKKGEKYLKTSVDRNDQNFAPKQTCNCVRELELIRDISDKYKDKVTELYSNYKCDRNGNYLPLQCSESVCYCVDENGFLDSKSILKTDGPQIKELPCYANYTEQWRLRDIFDPILDEE